MQHRNKGFLWVVLLTKRLYKKWTFLLLLALIPALVLGYGLVDKSDAGVLTIALSCQDWDDQAAAEMVRDLENGSQLIHFQVYPTEEAAEEAVRSARADAAWIFLEDTQERLEAFAHGFSDRDAFIRVVEREESVSTVLAREKLSAAAFTQVGKALYLQYLRAKVPALDGVSQDEFLEYFRQVNLNGQLFTFDSQGQEATAQEASYLTAPVRGLLAVVVVLSGLAGAMYHQQDKAAGTFARVPENRGFLLEMGCQLLILTNVLAVAEAALALTGDTRSFWPEAGAFVVFLFTCLGFSMLLSTLLSHRNAMAVALPVIAVAMLGVCPIFFDLGFLGRFQLLFPPTYFLRGLYQPQYLLWGLLYGSVTLLSAFALGKIVGNRKN